MSLGLKARHYIKDLLQMDITLIKRGDTESYSIKGYIQSIAIDERISEGIIDQYDIRAFFLPFYTINDSTVYVEEGDKIKYDNQEYVIVRVQDWYDIDGTKVYREVLCRCL